jgi:hypothetical protein
MHICPVEIGAVLIMFEQAQYSYWYLRWKLSEWREAWRFVYVPKDGALDD